MQNKREIKRVLWIDDNDKDQTREMFQDGEYCIISTMDEAIEEISSEHIYEYDTIVFDIDFSHGVDDIGRVRELLSQKIHLNQEELEDDKKFKNIGGYLLYVYLLVCGFPAERVAFLTGNTGAVESLQRMNEAKNRLRPLEEVTAEYRNAYNVAIATAKEAQAAVANGTATIMQSAFTNPRENFRFYIHDAEIAEKYTSDSVITACRECLSRGGSDADLRQLLANIPDPPVKDTIIDNTAEKMIERFNMANLQSPEYFAKVGKSISGHGNERARKWLVDARSEDMITRWLVLSASKYVTDLYQTSRNTDHEMSSQVGNLFNNNDYGPGNDPGIESSFGQLYSLFYGLRKINPTSSNNTSIHASGEMSRKTKHQEGPYYQAIMAMLIPFDANPKGAGRGPHDWNPGMDCDYYGWMQRALLWMSKKARDYCAHNYFGTSVQNSTALYIIMGTLTGILSKAQRNRIDDSWYTSVYELVHTNAVCDRMHNINKADSLFAQLLLKGKIKSGHTYGNNPTSYRPDDQLVSMGFNTMMDLTNEKDSTVRESYFIYTLAAYVIKWFGNLSDDEIKHNFGKGVLLFVKWSNEIVDSYVYPQNKAAEIELE